MKSSQSLVSKQAMMLSSRDSELSYDRNFITAVRAMQDFLLRPEDLKGLRVTTRRSPNEVDPPIHVYWRKDVQALSLQIWGSTEKLEAEKEKRHEQASRSNDKQAFPSLIKRLLSDRKSKKKKNKLRREDWPVRPLRMDSQGLKSQSGRVVLYAITINFCNFAGKLVAWGFTGSHAMFSEAIHSAADTCNQLILAYGINKSVKKPNEDHPYGYSNMQYVSSLISGVGIFCVGAGLSVYHGITGLTSPHEMESVTIAFVILAASFISESVTLGIALKSIRESASLQNMSVTEYVLGGYDPSVNVVLLEDLAAVLGVLIAAGAMGFSTQLGSHIPDAVGSIMIGGLLGTVASFMIYSNSGALVGRSIPEEKLMMINKELEGDIMVRQVHDVKGIDMGNGIIRYKAEVDVDGRELAKYYLQKNNMPLLLEDVQKIASEQELELFLLKHGENIVDCLGEQVDRIERRLKAMHPEVKYVDLEVL